MRTCPECGGEGECEYEVAVSAPMAWTGGWLEGRIMECQLCEGSGEVDDEYDEEGEE
tara:strand:- start:255 stop:425 length:171 start_codon:yes stop_codon:yes gene_type:complete